MRPIDTITENKYNKTDIYCPNCGKQTVWIDTCDDYYSGFTGYCLSCHKSHCNANDFYSIDKATIDELMYAVNLSRGVEHVKETKS